MSLLPMPAGFDMNQMPGLQNFSGGQMPNFSGGPTPNFVGGQGSPLQDFLSANNGKMPDLPKYFWAVRCLIFWGIKHRFLSQCQWLTQGQPGRQTAGGRMPFNMNALPAGGQFAGQMSGGQLPQMSGAQFAQMSNGPSAQPQALTGSGGGGSNAAAAAAGGGIAGAIGGLFGDITGSDLGKAAIGAAGVAAVNKAYGDLGDIGERAYSGGQDAAGKALEQTQFKPFSVTSSTGGSFNVGADGSATMNLGQQEQAIQDALMGDAAQRASQGFSGDAAQQAAGGQAYGLGQQFMGQVGQDQTQRRNDIYGDIRAMQSPEEERQRMALEERLLSQGRGGCCDKYVRWNARTISNG